MFWWYTHLGNFIGSYIAAWTAFSVVTLPRILPHAGMVLWLWPTAIGVPAIVLTTGYYQRKFAPRQEGNHAGSHGEASRLGCGLLAFPAAPTDFEVFQMRQKSKGARQQG